MLDGEAFVFNIIFRARCTEPDSARYAQKTHYWIGVTLTLLFGERVHLRIRCVVCTAESSVASKLCELLCEGQNEEFQLTHSHRHWRRGFCPFGANAVWCLALLCIVQQETYETLRIMRSAAATKQYCC